MPGTSFFMLSFEKAKSSQASLKKAYQVRLAKEAATLVKDGAKEWTKAADVFLYSRIYYFHRGNRTVDTDNVNKPILDALKGIVFADDSQVKWCMVAKIDIATNPIVDSEGLPEQWFEQLSEALTDDTRHDIIFIEIGEYLDAKIFFGRETR